ncbi:MAG TPA: hypothetical protein VE907_06305 [Gammaproteobacteria bacterium]|nr:hypothetical protein [Gammaproteobacteria bacterium]
MSKRARGHWPIAASSSRRPLIPQAPLPIIKPLARAVRALMGGGYANVVALSRRASLRIFAMIEQQQRDERAA